MPGRRLILLLVMLLVTLSVLSAGRDISRRGPAGQATTSTTGRAEAPTNGSERSSGASSGNPGATERKPPAQEPPGTVERTLPSDEPVRARLGERVVLRVRTKEPDIISVDELGVRAPTGPGTSGTLDLIAGSPGNYPVTLGVGQRRIGELSVRD